MKKILLIAGLLSLSQFNAQTTIFSETFESNSPTLAGWNAVDKDGDWINWSLSDDSSVAAMGFSGYVYASVSMYGAQNNLLISPAINLPSSGNLSLSFKVGSYFQSSPAEHYAVYILPANSTFTGNETPAFVETLSQGGVAMTKTINISGNAGQNVKVCFRHFLSEQSAIILDDVKIIQNTSLGTSETKTTEQFEIYPNPATDYLYFKSKSKILNAEVYDLSGRKMTSQLSDNKVDVSNLQKGNYMIKLHTKEGEVTQKFIKK